MFDAGKAVDAKDWTGEGGIGGSLEILCVDISSVAGYDQGLFYVLPYCYVPSLTFDLERVQIGRRVIYREV